MQRLAALFCCLVTLAVGCEAFTWKPCDADKVPFIPDTVQLIPDPPVIGNTVTFNIKGNAVHDVPSGSISIDVTFAGTQIYEEVDDLCSKTSCPIKTGPIDITYVQDLPPIAPPGEYDVQVVARDTQNVELMCVVVHFEMVPPSIPSWPGNNEAVATSRKMLKDNSKQAVV
eukprot:jgi/Chrzof1/4691/Cz14g23010.t1